MASDKIGATQKWRTSFLLRVRLSCKERISHICAAVLNINSNA